MKLLPTQLSFCPGESKQKAKMINWEESSGKGEELERKADRTTIPAGAHVDTKPEQPGRNIPAIRPPLAKPK